jgi:hypothetical protein
MEEGGESRNIWTTRVDSGSVRGRKEGEERRITMGILKGIRKKEVSGRGR